MGRGQTAKAFLPASNVLSSLKTVTATTRGLACGTSSSSFILSLAVGGRVVFPLLQSVLSPLAGRVCGVTVDSPLQRSRKDLQGFHRYGARSDRKSVSARFKRALLTQKPSQPPLGAWRAGRVHPHLFSFWQLGDALSFPRYSLSLSLPAGRVLGTQSILPCSVRTPCWPPVSPALHTPSTRTRTPRALLRGGGCRCSRFGLATHFSLGNIPPASTGFNWR